jgi:predicted nucleotidyltransferase component of viral defense system
MKSAMQLKALIGNLATEKNLPHEVILRNYMLERFLERVSLSKYKHQLILKGGLLIADMIGIEARSTMDLDATIKGVDLTEEALTAMLTEILAVPIDDGVQLTIRRLETIRDEADYPGFRVSIEAIIEKTKQVMKIDITTGDVITPKEIEYDYKLLVEDKKIGIMAYNTETIMAEKIETILSRSTASTRMRDYYDAHTLMALKEDEISWPVFTEAFQGTAEKRGSYNLLSEKGHENIEAIKQSEALANLWERYQDNNAYAANLNWPDVLASVERLYKLLVPGKPD